MSTFQTVFSDRIFTLLDKNQDGLLEFHELINGVELLTRGSQMQKLEFLFNLMDVHENSLSFDDDKLDALTDLFFDSMDEDNDGTITFNELKNELLKHPGLIDNLTFSGLQWIKPPTAPKKKTFEFRYFTSIYIRNNLRKIFFLIVYILTNIGLGFYAGWTHRQSHVFLIIARICGMNLNFNCTFIVILVLRTLITKFRETRLYKYLPFDQHIFFHKMVGVFIAVFAVVHASAHIANAVVVSQSGDIALLEMLLTTKAGIGWILGSAYITGWILLVILVVMVICSLSCVRRRGYFEVFYFSHMLYIPFWIGCILHGPDFWKWFVGPGFIFLCEKLIRTRILRRAKYGDVIIEEVNLLPSQVTHLVIRRPKNFKFMAGDYLFLNIPIIAKYEWHPFTISSAPELKGKMRTGYHYISCLLGPGLTKCTSILTIMMDIWTCHIDGPYGTGAREILESEHAVLICSGIGVTPMASILQSILLRYKTSRNCCPNCSYIWHDSDKIPESLMNLRKVDFIWINRNQKCFEWFVSLLTEIEIYQQLVEKTAPTKNGYLFDMQLYMTAAKQKTDMRGIGLQIALDLMRQKEEVDLITGLRTKTEPGRPNFNKLFHDISLRARGNVKVFYCGNQTLAKTVKQYCEKYKFGFSKEHF
ncbi:hypothetical protein KUTeg_011124 [Tegillarca granosa]|uniref:NADPH oxidase 5 n=1 Tax=Tegillarca granosa TaxID=220873 RepID=A0ABQ9F2Y7_TEGGR|nr:hypothetical protein KUTeg_011124 [Tegillarca granosa]